VSPRRTFLGASVAGDFRTGCPGVDVMIAIFGGFRQFSAKETEFFHKNQCYDFVSSQKTIFLPIFLAKIFLKS
jgi:hypothetical protein